MEQARRSCNQGYEPEHRRWLEFQARLLAILRDHAQGGRPGIVRAVLTLAQTDLNIANGVDQYAFVRAGFGSRLLDISEHGKERIRIGDSVQGRRFLVYGEEDFSSWKGLASSDQSVLR